MPTSTKPINPSLRSPWLRASLFKKTFIRLTARRSLGVVDDVLAAQVEEGEGVEEAVVVAVFASG